MKEVLLRLLALAIGVVLDGWMRRNRTRAAAERTRGGTG